MTGRLRVALLTREYPPEVYGGAGVHVTYLARELAQLVDLTVHCQGADRPDAVAHRPWDLLADANQALRVVSTDLSMAAAVGSAELVHSHTWYANLAGQLAAMLYDIPHVMTMHSLEVLRPWKAEQLGGGYAVSSWCERTAATSAAAVVAVSEGMRADIMTAYPEISPERVRVIRNGIDTNEYRPDPDTEVLDRYGIDNSRPYVIFVGRITRQKGLPVLLRAASGLIPDAPLVLCAGQADTPEQHGVRHRRGGVPHRRDSRGGRRWRDGTAGTARRAGSACARPERPAVCPRPGRGDGAGGPQARGGGIRLARHCRPNRRSLCGIGSLRVKSPFFTRICPGVVSAATTSGSGRRWPHQEQR